MMVLMLNRPRPTLQLLAFLSGGFAMGATVGLVVIFAFRPGLLGSAHFTLPKVQIVIGVLAVLMAAVVATGVMPAPRLPAQARGLAYARRCRWRGWRAWGSHCRPSTTWRYWPSSSLPRRPLDAGRGTAGVQRRRVRAR